ncbi:MAG: SH3 domain-containing protein [Desulfurellales bacterium]|nr:MAG: SH3 domain-containing protein [Desulfurellales bacterium]
MKKYLALVTFVILSLACGAQVPTAEPVYTPQAKASIQNPVFTHTAAPTENVQTVTALGKVNVRTCPATSCEVIGVIEAGAVIEVGLEIKNDIIDCPRWYPVVYNGRGAFVCSEWFTK